MPKRPDREYRCISIDEFRTADDGGYMVEGYATTFDVPYDLYNGVKECIESTALREADMSDVIFQYDHCGLVMARIKNGSMTVTLDAHGMHIRADLGGTAKGRELHEAIKNGLVTSMSWGFRVAKDGWRYDYENKVSYITKVEKVFDVSAVSRPANNDTEISARSYFKGVIELMEAEERGKCDEEEKEERKRIATRLVLAR